MFERTVSANSKMLIDRWLDFGKGGLKDVCMDVLAFSSNEYMQLPGDGRSMFERTLSANSKM